MLESERKYLRRHRRGFFATSYLDRPTLVPVCFCFDEHTIYTAIDGKPKGKRLARVSNVLANGRVAFIVDDYSERWSELSYLLLHGDAELLTNGREATKARKMLRRKYPQYRGTLSLDRRPVLAIRIRERKFWSYGKKDDSGEL